jgi:zinc finger protein
MDQPLRRIQDPNNYQTIQNLLDKLKEILGDEEDEDDKDLEAIPTTKPSEKEIPMPPFTIKLDDPSGNSFIEFVGSMSDPQWSKKSYHRTLKQNIALGLVNPEGSETGDAPKVANPEAINVDVDEVGEDEILVFPGVCSSCGRPIDTKMKKVNIPYFKVCASSSSESVWFFIPLIGRFDHVYELRPLWISR